VCRIKNLQWCKNLAKPCVPKFGRANKTKRRIKMNKPYNPDEYEHFIQDWKTARPEYEPFCYDGVLIDNLWKYSSKIMFLLKETYSHFNKIRGEVYGGKGTSRTFWRRMKMWTYIIDEALKGKIPTFEDTKKIKDGPNDSIAYVNLKKYAERKEYNKQAYSDDNDIFKYVEQDKEFLLKQIDLINPRIILCSGTFKFCRKLYDNLTYISDRLYKTRNIYFIDFGHLSKRGSYKNDYDTLINIMKPLIAEL